LCGRLLDRAESRARIDLIRCYAQPVPTTIIAEMLGVPVGDRYLFQRWSQALIASGRAYTTDGQSAEPEESAQ
jgi:cytochrome P450